MSAVRNRNHNAGLAPLTLGATAPDAQRRLTVLVAENGTLAAVSRKIGISKGYLSQIASGRRRASNRARAALGLPPATAPAPVCAVHGVVHVGKCKREKLSLAKLLARKGAMKKIARILAWAEGDRR